MAGADDGDGSINIWVCPKMSCTPKPNGFADHYPVFKWLFHWEYTLFSDIPIFIQWLGLREHLHRKPSIFP